MIGEKAAGERARPNILKFSVGLLVAVLLAWLVIRSANVSALVEQDGAQGGLLSAGDPRVAFAEAGTGLRAEKGSVDPAALDKALEASRDAPLDETPFLLAGAQALREGNGERAERLLTEARERNPRSRTARFLLLEHYVRAGRIKEAAEEMAALTRLMPDVRPILIAGLARFAESLPNNPAIAEVLKGDPAVRRGVLEHLAATGGAPELILRLSRGLRPSADANWPEAVVNALVEQGDVGQAYAHWRRFSGFPTGPAPAGVFNGGFEFLPAPPPFNWRLANDTAELSGGLRIDYPGERQTVLAEQLLLLPAGSYSMKFEAKGEDAEGGSGLVWTVRCHGEGARIASVAVRASPVIAQPNDAEFTVSADCPAQWLRLVGVPGQGGGALTATITDFAINQLGEP